MKNRVVPIRGFIQRIRKHQTLDQETTSYLDLVERESARLEDMTQNMLSFAQHAPLEMKEVDVGLLLEEVRQPLHEPFRNKWVRLVCRCEGQSHRIKLDQERTKEAIVNLLYNALYASSEGKEVRILAHSDGAFLRIRVEDEGTGIAQEHADKIFLAFFTTKPKGTGLGLAITKRIVEKHGGKIRVVSAPGKGTSVLLDFPISRDTPEPNPAPWVRLDQKE